MHVVPGFWDWLTIPHETVIVQSIRAVYNELSRNKTDPDELAHWANKNKALFIPNDSKEIQQAATNIANYLNSHKLYTKREIDRFLFGADLWLVACRKILHIPAHSIFKASIKLNLRLPA